MDESGSFMDGQNNSYKDEYPAKITLFCSVVTTIYF